MEKLPEIKNKLNLPLEIAVHPYVKDHNFNGRVVFPAVESCRALAENITEQVPGVNPCHLYDALFDKFIDINPGQTIIKAINEVDIYDNGDIISRLITKIKSEKAGITRAVRHVTINFKNSYDRAESAIDHIPSLSGEFFEIPGEKIYKDLVQFGPAYHNIAGNVRLNRSGAEADVKAALHSAMSGPIGSPFPFDAALHAACVWGQRYCGIAAFPIGFEKRFIIRPTIPGKIYHCRIIPAGINNDILSFNLWIFNDDGNINEAAFEVRLRDINAGQIRPPEWLKKGADDL